MKAEKMSFKNIKDVLSRDEMKAVMAGSGTCAAHVPAGTSPGTGGYAGGSYTRNSGGRTVRGVSKSEAMNFASNG